MQRLVDRGVDGAPVVDAAGTVVGMLSTGDLIVQETQLHFPTVISFLGGHVELPVSEEAASTTTPRRRSARPSARSCRPTR